MKVENLDNEKTEKKGNWSQERVSEMIPLS